MKSKKYYYFYKITNNINGCYYYGIHSTNLLDDGYMGSGTRLNNAIKKYGLENFTKEILKYFDNWEDLCEYEKQIVTKKLVESDKCYNLIVGGQAPIEKDFFKWDDDSKNKITGDKNGSYGTKWMTNGIISKKVNKDDINSYLDTGWKFGRKFTERGYKNIVASNVKQKAWIHNSSGSVKMVYIEDAPSYLNEGYVLGRCIDDYERELNTDINGNIISMYKAFKIDNNVTKRVNDEFKCILINGEKWLVDKRDPKFINYDAIKCSYDYDKLVRVINETGAKITVRRNDPKLLDGTYKIYKADPNNPCCVSVKDKDGNIFKVTRDDERLLSGELVGQTKGMKYSKNHGDKISKSKHKGEKMWVHKIREDNSYDIKFIFKTEFEKYKEDGYKYGRGESTKKLKTNKS